MTMAFKDLHVRVCLSVCLSSTVEDDTKSENRTCIYDPSGMPDSQSLACIIFFMHILLQTRHIGLPHAV